MIGLGGLPPTPISRLPLISGFSFMGRVAKKVDNET